MARVKINMPEKFIFSTEIPVRITDLNYGKHLGNDTLLSILHEARVRFLNSLGYSELDVEGAGIIMADVAVAYIAEAFYGDTLLIEIAVSDFSRVGFDILYKVSSKQRTIAEAKTGIVFYDYGEKKVVPVPVAFGARFTGGVSP